MGNLSAISIHDRDATNYDGLVRDYGSHVHDVLFGLCYEYVSVGDSLLDLGIGTGLSSIPFARVGLIVTGIDGSSAMLAVCRAKRFAAELTRHNLLEAPLPYADATFHHVISSGVFHFIRDLTLVVGEATRLLRPLSIFAFTTATPSNPGTEMPEEPVTCIRQDVGSGVPIYAHTPSCVQYLLECNSLSVLKSQLFYAHAQTQEETPLLMAAYVTKKHSRR